LRVRIEGLTAPFDQAPLRELTLQMTWDEEPEPAVWTPLGDFFGTTPGANRYRSLPLGITDDGVLYSYWYMPFGKTAKIEIGNDGKDERRLHVEVAHVERARPASRQSAKASSSRLSR
jgi:hypothetical protein